jgi:hypothetical protein
MDQTLSAHPRSGLSIDMTAPDGRGRKIGRNDPVPAEADENTKNAVYSDGPRSSSFSLGLSGGLLTRNQRPVGS